MTWVCKYTAQFPIMLLNEVTITQNVFPNRGPGTGTDSLCLNAELSKCGTTFKTTEPIVPSEEFGVIKSNSA